MVVVPPDVAGGSASMKIPESRSGSGGIFTVENKLTDTFGSGLSTFGSGSRDVSARAEVDIGSERNWYLVGRLSLE